MKYTPVFISKEADFMPLFSDNFYALDIQTYIDNNRLKTIVCVYTNFVNIVKNSCVLCLS